MVRQSVRGEPTWKLQSDMRHVTAPVTAPVLMSVAWKSSCRVCACVCVGGVGV